MQVVKQVLSPEDRLVPGLGTHFSKHFSLIFSINVRAFSMFDCWAIVDINACLRSSFVALLLRPSIFPMLSILSKWLWKKILFAVGNGEAGRVLELECDTGMVDREMRCELGLTYRTCRVLYRSMRLLEKLSLTRKV